MFAIAFPNIDPILIQIGPVAVRWYALAYIAGLFGGLFYMRRLVKSPPALMTPQHVDDFFLWALIGRLSKLWPILPPGPSGPRTNLPTKP